MRTRYICYSGMKQSCSDPVLGVFATLMGWQWQHNNNARIEAKLSNVALIHTPA